ncbi:Nif3-like dinuclear metal center hexameric protein [Cohnella caldifontis]|uniref:Nif3-like dinuclear metal center hexameric protein n=1 Tax=Cohnella caldifontis TaxID=3027471 RepID=UPI0023EC2BFA|nr:Nif3-like dinuclear metal center hexameric protein [Cohnella sp. YIM B05605]
MKITVQDVIRELIQPVGPLENTVDTLKFGDPAAKVNGIVTTFMPSQRVLEEAAAWGANLVIAHEAPFYHHRDAFAETLESDPVVRAKRGFIQESGLAIFRFHDYWHRYRPDGIMEGLIEALGWSAYAMEHLPTASIAEIPPMTALEAAEQAKKRLGIRYVRFTGNPDAICRRVGLMAGYRGGGTHAIPLIEQYQLDLVLCGEGPEWETPEYIRDAARQGRGKALITLGHAESEAAGMKLLADRLQARYPGLPVRYIAEEPIFRIL